MTFTIVSEIKWEKLSKALETWIGDSDYKMNQDYVTSSKFLNSLQSHHCVVVNGLDETLSDNLHAPHNAGC